MKTLKMLHSSSVAWYSKHPRSGNGNNANSMISVLQDLHGKRLHENTNGRHCMFWDTNKWYLRSSKSSPCLTPPLNGTSRLFTNLTQWRKAWWTLQVYHQIDGKLIVNTWTKCSPRLINQLNSGHIGNALMKSEEITAKNKRFNSTYNEPFLCENITAFQWDQL